MVEYQKKVGGNGTKETILTGRKCDRCGFTQLDNDDDVWTAAGL